MDSSELTVHDTVYGTFSLPSYIRSVVETVEFDRLKQLKQLGTSNAVFKTALHTRYDHSLGACYLAGKLLDTLNKTLEVPVSDDERKCVMIAAALHDVGHGPFSHLWEKFVETYGSRWRHERSSVELARNILDLTGNVTEKQIILICALISGEASDLLDSGRQFLAHIVSSDVDVDRCDYLQRDAHNVPDIIQPSHAFRELFNRVRVVTEKRQGGKALLAYHCEDYPLVYEMACARQTFHRRCYQHPKVLGAELMMLDVMYEAERAGFRFTRNGQSEQLSKVHEKPDLFKYLSDNVTEEIAASSLPQLEKAKQLIERLRNDDLYSEITSFPVDMTREIVDFNEQQGAEVVVQAVRYIKSTEQWFHSFNVTFYKPGAQGIEMVSLEEAKQLHLHRAEPSVVPCESSAEEVHEYIIYCTSADPVVQRTVKHHFCKLLSGNVSR
uniref:HD domain-containing protein n=1 Tax=Anopheles farauti TaxID=69004 RepID=A0A182QFF5_9DIPT